jgi:hypothetical protein
MKKMSFDNLNKWKFNFSWELNPQKRKKWTHVACSFAWISTMVMWTPSKIAKKWMIYKQHFLCSFINKFHGEEQNSCRGAQMKEEMFL